MIALCTELRHASGTTHEVTAVDDCGYAQLYDLATNAAQILPVALLLESPDWTVTHVWCKRCGRQEATTDECPKIHEDEMEAMRP